MAIEFCIESAAIALAESLGQIATAINNLAVAVREQKGAAAEEAAWLAMFDAPIPFTPKEKP